MTHTTLRAMIWTLGSLLLGMNSVFSSPIADSQTGFADTQGKNRWYYGENIGSDFTSEGWTFVNGRWESPEMPGKGKGFIGNYPEAFDYEVSYNQAFWNSSASITHAWKSDAKYPNARLTVRMFFASQQGKPVRLRIFLNDNEVLDNLVNSDAKADWFDVASVEVPVGKDDMIFIAVSTTDNNSDFTNHGLRAVIND